MSKPSTSPTSSDERDPIRAADDLPEGRVPRAEPLSELVAEEELRHDPYAAMREPNYRLFACGWLLASTGMRMQEAAILWEIYERTRNPMLVGAAGLARALPVVLLALPAGQIIDMVDRKRVLIGTQIAFAMASTLMMIASHEQFATGWMYAILVLMGCARVFNGPSRSSLLPQIVPARSFHNAVTWNSGLFHLSAAAGPWAAGWMIERSGHVWGVYGVTGVLCLVMAVLTCFIKPTGTINRPGDRRLWQVVRPSVLLPGILEGVHHIRREKPVLAAIALDLMAVLFGGATALLPLYAADILHVGPEKYGALKSAQFVGALVMAIVLAHRPPFKRAGITLLLSVAGFGVGTIAFGFSTNFYFSLAMLFLLGAVDGISVVIRHVLVTVRTPDHLRGRVAAVNSVFIESSNEVGNFESGAVARLATLWLGLGVAGGAVFSVVSGGVGTLLVVAFVAWKWPALTSLGELRPDAAPDPVPTGPEEGSRIADGEKAPGSPCSAPAESDGEREFAPNPGRRKR